MTVNAIGWDDNKETAVCKWFNSIAKMEDTFLLLMLRKVNHLPLLLEDQIVQIFQRTP